MRLGAVLCGVLVGALVVLAPPAAAAPAFGGEGIVAAPLRVETPPTSTWEADPGSSTSGGAAPAPDPAPGPEPALSRGPDHGTVVPLALAFPSAGAGLLALLVGWLVVRAQRTRTGREWAARHVQVVVRNGSVRR